MLSGDKDFYRYYQARFPIFSDYVIENGFLKLIKSDEFDHPKPRKLISPLPITYS